MERPAASFALPLPNAGSPKDYSFIDNNQLLIVDVEKNELIFQKTTYRGSSSTWLDSNRILQATRPIDSFQKDTSGKYHDTAWIYHLDTRRIEMPPPTCWTAPLATTPDKRLLAHGRLGMFLETIDARKPLDQEPSFTTNPISAGLDKAQLSDDGNYLAVS